MKPTAQDILRTLKKYKQNLKIVNNFIYSYKTKVAIINHYKKEVKQIPYVFKYKNRILTTSPTTQKHINYVTNKLNYKLIIITFKIK